MLNYVFVVPLLLIHYQSCSSSILKDECCKAFPKAMDINTFQTMVANGEDWAVLFGFLCPSAAPMNAIDQFRVSMNVSNGVLSRKINFRPDRGEPCVGATNEIFHQVGSRKAVFRREGADGVIREDRFLDTGCLHEYYILFTCLDLASARRKRCIYYGVAIIIREDPPRNFPWDKAIDDLKRFGIDARDFNLLYVDERTEERVRNSHGKRIISVRAIEVLLYSLLVRIGDHLVAFKYETKENDDALEQSLLCSSSILKDECCRRFPKAMGINTFQTRVANGEDWTVLFGFLCPFSANAEMNAIDQFRVSMNVTNGVLSRRINFRPELGEPCVGATNVSFDQVGSKKAVFRQEGAGGLIREDRYLDTGCLDDYYILFSCFDRASARRGRCFNFGVAIGIREDPPRNFPWDKAVYDLKRFGIDARDFNLLYVGESKIQSAPIISKAKFHPNYCYFKVNCCSPKK